MKRSYKISIIIMMISSLPSCSVKSTNSKTSSTSSTSSVSTSAGTTAGGATNSDIGCDGINPGTGVSKCYYKNIPTIQVMGVTKANIGKTIWSSASITPSSQFSSDAIFHVRIVPRIAKKTDPAVNPSVPGKSCNHKLTQDQIATKLTVRIKIQTREENDAGVTSGEIATLSADVEKVDASGVTIKTPSPVWHFTKRVTGTNYVLKVVSVESNSRTRQGGNYGDASDIPLSYPEYPDATHSGYPTECVAFDIQYSTDSTLDLPGPIANPDGY